MNALGARIARLIGQQGPICIAEFMTIALHDPQAGYYATRDPFGGAGDFTTAPEISQMFGEFLGLWCVQLWHDQGRPSRPLLLELGPGRGTLMSDALRAARVAPEFLEGLDVVLVEASPALQSVQHERLQEHGDRIRWMPRFDPSIAGRPLFLLANEFFDALPVRQYVKTMRGWRERMVRVGAGGEFEFALSPVSLPDDAIPASRADAPEGGVYEVSAAALSLAEDIARAVAANGGGALIVDYGYDRVEFGETLQAVARHSFAAVLDEPGESDLSAHVDFPAFASAAAKAGATVFGPASQGEFLEELGIAQRVERLAAANPNAEETLRAALTRLTGADEMGMLFKVLAMVPPQAPTPPGF